MSVRTSVRPSVRNYLQVEPVPEETSTHSHLSGLSIILYQLPPSTTSLRPIASSLLNLCAWQSFCISQSFLVYLLVWNTPLHTPYISSPSHCLLFHSTCQNHRNLFCCSSTDIMSFIPNFSLNSFYWKLHFSVIQNMPHFFSSQYKQ